METKLPPSMYILRNTNLGSSRLYSDGSNNLDIEYGIKFSPNVKIVQTEIEKEKHYLLIVNFFSIEGVQVKSCDFDVNTGKLHFTIDLSYDDIHKKSDCISEFIIDLSKNKKLHILIESLLRFDYLVTIKNPLNEEKFNLSGQLAYLDGKSAGGTTQPLEDYPFVPKTDAINDYPFAENNGSI